MQQLTQNMYIDDFNADGRTVKAGSRTARMIAQYNKDCDPAAAAEATSADSAMDGAVQGYQGMKKIAKESNSKIDDQDASIQAACLFGVRASTGLQLGDQASTGMVGDSVPVCLGAAIAYKFGALTNTAFDSPHDLSKASDESTRNAWASQDIAADMKQCTDRRQNYEGVLACSCVAGARFGAAKAITASDDRAKESLMQRSNTVCQRLTAKFAEADGPDAVQKYRTFVSVTARLTELQKIEQATKAGDYTTAYTISRQHAAATEADEVKETGKAGKRTAAALIGLSWGALFAHEFSKSLDASERAIKLSPNDLVPVTNQAHALMFLGRAAEAKAIYLAHKGEPLQGKTWEKVISEDFGKLRQAGITHPMMAEMEEALGTTGQASASATPGLPSPISVRPPPGLEEKATPPKKTMAAVVPDPLTLRIQPDKSADAIVVLNKGAQVEVISADANGWSQVQLSDQGTTFKGYVNGKYLTPFTMFLTEPVIPTEPTDVDEVPSFCGHEHAPMEFVICSNSDLALQDSAMAKSYHILLTRVSDTEALRSSQRQWNVDRRQKCNVPSSGRPARQIPPDLVQCVFKMTEARKSDLRAGRY